MQRAKFLIDGDLVQSKNAASKIFCRNRFRFLCCFQLPLVPNDQEAALGLLAQDLSPHHYRRPSVERVPELHALASTESHTVMGRPESLCTDIGQHTANRRQRFVKGTQNDFTLARIAGGATPFGRSPAHSAVEIQ